MDFQEEQYIIDGVIYNITETPQIHQRLRSDPDFAQQYIYGATSQLQSSVETNENKSINEEIQDISNNNTIDDNNTSDNNTNNNDTIKVHEKLHNTSNEEIGGFKWPHEAILLLIEEYNIRQNDFVSGRMSHKKVWGEIAGEMMKHGHNVTGLQ
ncbi:uncharacterized protein LOC112456499, partial [Temnothorax curvispinosus]|uniref:Uncharacterized protein LOC112456499 n=1 Tax=Temnothorax curvispinosus TaxID=300111 RepID=A0A6J1Q1M3_9HYME